MRKLLRDKSAENLKNRQLPVGRSAHGWSVGSAVSVHPVHGPLQLTLERGERIGFSEIWSYNPPKL